MPKIDRSKIPFDNNRSYPKEFADVIAGREKQRLGDAVGLTQFGVNVSRIKAHSKSALRHWHESEDEFIYMLEGELVLCEDSGETVLRPGDAAGWKAGVQNGHCLVNRSNRDAVFLEIGSRMKRDSGDYSDIDMKFRKDESGVHYLHKSGEPYPQEP